MTVLLELFPGELDQMPSPRHPDPIVFGPPGTDPTRTLPNAGRLRICECGAQWHGDAPCWHCGWAAT